MANQEVEIFEDGFTNDELINLFLDAQNHDDQNSDVMTCPEIAEALGRSINYTRKQIKQLLDSGKVEVAEKRTTNIVGNRTTVRGFRLVKEKEG